MCHESQSYPRSCHRALLLTYQSAHTLTHAYCKKPNQMTDKLSSGLLLIGGQMLLLQLRNTQGPYILTFHKHVWRYQCNVSKAILFKLRSPKKTNKKDQRKIKMSKKKPTICLTRQGSTFLFTLKLLSAVNRMKQEELTSLLVFNKLEMTKGRQTVGWVGRIG